MLLLGPFYPLVSTFEKENVTLIYLHVVSFSKAWILLHYKQKATH